MAYANIEDQRVAARRSYQRHKEARKAKVRAYAVANPDKIRTISLARTADTRRGARVMERSRSNARRGKFDAHVVLYRMQPKPPKPPREPLHEAHVRRLRDDKTLMCRWRYANDPAFVVKERLRTQMRKRRTAAPSLPETIRYALKHGTSPRSIFDVLGYTADDLRQHLERQFIPGMSWTGFSRTGWHIDHIVPRAAFDLTTEQGVRECWALSNLRPLSARDNMLKSAKRTFLI